MADPPPYDGPTCTERDHVVSADVEGTTVRRINEADERMFACDCGCVMIGNGRVEVRFGLLRHRFPDVAA